MSEQLKCPLPDCGGDLYLTISMAIPIEDDSTAEALRTYRNAVTESWTVDCTEGHTLLHPAADYDACQFGDTPDGSDDDDACIDDMARLHALYPAPPVPVGSPGKEGK